MAFFATPPRRMAHTLRALAWLLQYPDERQRAALPEIAQALAAEGALGGHRLGELQALVQRLQQLPALRAEAEYVELFDRRRRFSLHLFEHVHGDGRDRGPALVDLAQTYAQAGALMTPGELPDHLPVVLEFASTQPPDQARAFLRETAHLVRTIFSALHERGSAYASVLAAVLELAGERAEAVVLPPEEDADIDATWAEPAAFDGCSNAGQARAGAAQPIHIHRRPGPEPTRRAA
jgi:nitrate reductase molybdenum cofactor assembly chaperone NarJ/NarW